MELERRAGSIRLPFLRKHHIIIETEYRSSNSVRMLFRGFRSTAMIRSIFFVILYFRLSLKLDWMFTKTFEQRNVEVKWTFSLIQGASNIMNDKKVRYLYSLYIAWYNKVHPLYNRCWKLSHRYCCRQNATREMLILSKLFTVTTKYSLLRYSMWVCGATLNWCGANCI